MWILAAVLAVLALSPMSGYAGWFGPSDYDECIIESMKGVTSDKAAILIMRSCMDKFEEKSPPEKDLPASALAELSGRAGVVGGFLKRSFYNGDQYWTVTEVTVLLSPQGKEKSSGSVQQARKYKVGVRVFPLSTSTFDVRVDADNSIEYSWSIVQARGYRDR